jgi:hypothetical protein
MKRSGLPKYVTWVHVNGNRYAPARKHDKGYYFKSLPGTEEFASEYQRWLTGHDSEREGVRGTKPGSVSALVAKFYRSANGRTSHPPRTAPIAESLSASAMTTATSQ